MKFVESLLWPLSLPYAGVASLRARAYEAGLLGQRRLQGKVISVGNLTVGGTGKTPIVAWIAERLARDGKRAGILSRGYKGDSVDGSTEKTSDEVRLLQARLGEAVAYGIGPNRYANGERLAKQGVEWFILDDGFQHLQLARDVDIVLIDATNPFGGGRVLPSGRLREPRSALKRADIVVITRSEHAAAVETVIRRFTDAPLFYAQPQLESIRIWRGGDSVKVDSQSLKRVFAFCGIGNPGAFVANLRGWGFGVVGQTFFRDHHRYTRQDALELEEAARAAGAESLICTEKDIFNLDGVRFEEFEVRYCTIAMHVLDAQSLWTEIIKRAKA